MQRNIKIRKPEKYEKMEKYKKSKKVLKNSLGWPIYQDQTGSCCNTMTAEDNPFSMDQPPEGFFLIEPLTEITRPA